MIKIVTDSTSYLPSAFVREHDIRVIPLYVHFGEQAFKEGVELSNAEFYSRLKASPTLPTTSQPSPGEFHTVFKELHDAGHEILCPVISSRLSGTWNSAMAAKEMLPDARISVVDSLSTSVGLEMLLEVAVELIRGGQDRDSVTAQLEELKRKIHILFVVDTLEQLAKGGRIGNAKAFLGTVLKIKPILFLHEGAIEPLEQVRSKSKAITRILELIQEYVGTDGPRARTAITHALAANEAKAVSQELTARLGCRPPLCSELGPVIGTHTGAGVVGIAAYV